MPISPVQLSRLTHHKWALPIVAELHTLGGGAKFVQLVSRTSAHRLAAEQALDELIALGLVMPNPGHGHPLRPEFVLTPLGVRAGGPSVALRRALVRTSAEPIATLKWPMPALLTLSRGALRFREARDMLVGVTDRALVGALRSLRDVRLLHTRPCEHDARADHYLLAPRARLLVARIDELPAL